MMASLEANRTPQQSDVSVKRAINNSEWDENSTLQHRDILVKRAINNSEWHRVIELIKMGVTAETSNSAFWAAVRNCKLECIKELAMIDKNPDKINFALQDCISNSRWDYVAEFLCLGVGPEQEIQTLKDAMSHNLWDQVPDLLKHCYSWEVKTLVLSEAIRQCQWQCVTSLVSLGILSEVQKQYVCHEALTWGHWDCLLELLKQGISEPYSSWIVDDAVKWNRWQPVVDVVMANTAYKNLQRLVLIAFILHERLDIFIYTLQRLSNIADEHLTSVMSIAAKGRVDDFLYLLITRIGKGRRIFEQLCFTEHFSSTLASLVFHRLRLEDDVELAFHVAVTQRLWNFVLQLLDHPRVSQKAKRDLFSRAIREDNWGLVTEMGCRHILKGDSRRFMFLEAVRQGKFEWALNLYKKRCISDDDIAFAIKMYVNTVSTDGVWELFKLCRKKCSRATVLVYILQHAVSSWNISYGREAILKACKLKCSRDVFKAVQGDMLSSKDLLVWSNILTDRSIITKRQTWKMCLPVLDKAIDCDACDMYDIKRLFKSLELTVLSAIQEFCTKYSFRNLSIYMSIIRKEWGGITVMVDTKPEKLSEGIAVFGLEKAVRQEEWEAAALLLKHLPSKCLHYNVFEYIAERDFSPLFEILSRNGLHDWILEIALTTSRLDVVEKEIDDNHNLEISEGLIERIAECDGWDLVCKLLDRYSGSECDFSRILAWAVGVGEIKCVEKLLQTHDPLTVTFDGESLLQMAVLSNDNKEEMVRLCITSGVSTHQPCNDDSSFVSHASWSIRSPMRIALHNGQIPIIKLLHESGSCSNRELYHLKTDPELRSRLENQGRGDIVLYLEKVATTPRTLHSLCRLTVSHVIGCRPGRNERIKSLPVPEVVKNSILFKDL